MKDDERRNPAADAQAGEAVRADQVLPDDHPFAVLAGHDPRLVKAMGSALRVLQANTNDPGLKELIGEASAGRLSFRELMDSSTFSAAFEGSAEAAKQAVDARREAMSEAQSAELAAATAEHVARLTDPDLMSQIRRAFGGLAD